MIASDAILIQKVKSRRFCEGIMNSLQRMDKESHTCRGFHCTQKLPSGTVVTYKDMEKR